jgi:hypothetical protein
MAKKRHFLKDDLKGISSKSSKRAFKKCQNYQFSPYTTKLFLLLPDPQIVYEDEPNFHQGNQSGNAPNGLLLWPEIHIHSISAILHWKCQKEKPQEMCSGQGPALFSV